jgi:transposase
MARTAPAVWQSQHLLAAAHGLGRTGVLLKLWRAFLAQLNDRQKLRWDEGFAEGSFVPAKKGDRKSGRPHAARARSGWVWSRARVLRREQSLDAASPAEVTRPERTLGTVAVGRPGQPGRPRTRPERLMADRGDDGNPLRARLARRGLEPIIPARRHNRRATHQEGRKLRRYRRRWLVERTVGWLGHFRRLVMRDERLLTTSAGLFHLACALLTLRRVLK